MSLNNIPVIYYHSVADNNTHQLGDLSLPIKVFEKQMRYLSRNSFKTISLSELYTIKISGMRPPRKTVVLTFDDGYLDNWVFAYPVLKKYGLKANIFVNPQFIDPYNGERPTLEDVWNNRIEREKLCWWGYVSYKELITMSKDGTMDVHSHGMTHSWHFFNNNIIDFRHPGDYYYWMDWNLQPGKRPFWLTKGTADAMTYGYPIYEFGMGLLVRKYFDDPALADYLMSYVRARGGAEFFRKNCWREELFSKKKNL